MKIRWKLVFGFGTVIALTFLFSVISLFTLNRTNDDYYYLLNFPQKRLLILEGIKENFSDMRRIVATAAASLGNTEALFNYEQQFNQSYEKIQSNMADYIALNEIDTLREKELLERNMQKINELQNLASAYRSEVMEMTKQLTGDTAANEVTAVIQRGVEISNAAIIVINDLHEQAESYTTNKSLEISQNADFNFNLLLVISIILYIVSISFALVIGLLLTKPLNKLLYAMNNLVKGNLNINKSKVSKDEIGQLTLATYDLADTMQLLIQEIKGVGNSFNEGDIEARVNDSLFEGSYSEVAKIFNDTFYKLIDETIVFMNCISEFGSGNFRADIPKLPGKKSLMNENINMLRKNLTSVASDIGLLIKDASVGKLSSRVETSKYKGDWAEILNNLNELMEIIIAPINEATAVLSFISKGNFETKVEGDYKGDFLSIKNSINETVKNTASYINEISMILDAVANDDLTKEITRDYVGKYSDIKIALNNIVKKFNIIISNILAAADQVAAGSKQVSESSAMLAQGTSEQSSSILELNATVAEISQSTIKNSEDAQTAEELANASKVNAKSGNEDMKNMLISMKNISDSSNNIASIIKVIDYIAFQTNLLALNAAVEASRAAEHGKGFSVVAKEVRSLSGKSQDSARETANLIDESIANVNDGTKIANTTSEALRTILKDADQVADIITSIAEASRKQAKSIENVTDGLAQITEVVQNNSATSEEVAATSEELSGQAETLRNLVNVFKLKK